MTDPETLPAVAGELDDLVAAPSARPHAQPRNPLHGVTLERMLTELSARYGWDAMGEQVRIRCFTEQPSVASSLAFLRRTPWAREKVERMYRRMLREQTRATRRDGTGRAVPGRTG